MFGLWSEENFTPVEIPEWAANLSYSKKINSFARKITSFVKQFNFFSQKPGWIEGNIRGYSYRLKVYRDPSNMGINGGKISKLELWKNGFLAVNYDRGWDKKPSTKEIRNTVDELICALDPGHITRRVSKCC